MYLRSAVRFAVVHNATFSPGIDPYVNMIKYAKNHRPLLVLSTVCFLQILCTPAENSTKPSVRRDRNSTSTC